MSDDKNTPIPSSDFRILTETVGRIEGRITNIQEEQLPPIVKTTQESRDGLLILTEKQKVNQQRLKKLEEISTQVRDCDKADVIAANTGAITAQERELAGLSRWRWWLMGIIAVAVSVSTGYAITANGDMRAEQERNRAQDRDISRHDTTIKTLQIEQRNNRELIIKEVRGIPVKVQQNISVRTVEDAIAGEPLTENERARIRAILKRAEKRTR